MDQGARRTGTGSVRRAVLVLASQASRGRNPERGIPVEAGAATSVPAAGAAGAVQPRAPAHLAAPADVRPLAANALPREGKWQTVGRTVQGLPAVRVTYLRPDAVHTSLLAGVMWMDTKLLQASLIPGTQVPGGDRARRPKFRTPAIRSSPRPSTRGSCFRIPTVGSISTAERPPRSSRGRRRSSSRRTERWTSGAGGAT